jgi:hypothetical protein
LTFISDPDSDPACIQKAFKLPNFAFICPQEVSIHSRRLPDLTQDLKFNYGSGCECANHSVSVGSGSLLSQNHVPPSPPPPPFRKDIFSTPSRRRCFLLLTHLPLCSFIFQYVFFPFTYNFPFISPFSSYFFHINSFPSSFQNKIPSVSTVLGCVFSMYHFYTLPKYEQVFSLVLRIRSDFEPDPTSRHRLDRIRILLSKNIYQHFHYY